jgi:hypothetical protein
MPFNELLTKVALMLDNGRLGSLGEASPYAEPYARSSMRSSSFLEPPMESDVMGSGELLTTRGNVVFLTCKLPLSLTNPLRN